MAGIGRSLQALPEGIEKAKKALKRQNLTQTALAHEKALASWSTINKFFNGKPVDRAIFMEICETLNLDWQEIALPAEVEEEDTSDELLAAVQHHAQRARLDLEPYILPRIRRTALLEKCLQLIRHSIERDKQNIIPIIGSAGYGKSTILGSIYDELAAERLSNKSGWIALARCDDLIESVGTFAIELGEKVSGYRESITEIVKRLTAVYGKGVLLLDTLDIVLTKSLVSVLRSLLSEFLEIGTTFVFTCRDQDYSYFFEPYHESFAGFRDRVNSSCRIPPFDDDEVKEAAREFVRLNLRTNTSDNSTDFADKIVALSADSKSLQDITRNPLLLALLCDLFASQGKVPEDLTVSQLYAKYWDWKIAKVRKTSQSLQVCMAKEKLCLEIAELMYNQSSERLRDFIYESNLNQSEIEVLAYSELKSDGVLKEIGGKRIIFFHQTFLEYAIARWLYGTHTGEQARQQLEGELNASETTYSRYYLWTVFRQLLTLVNLSEFQRLAHQFNKTKILPFRSLAFAAVSRSEPESVLVLLSLLEIALSKDYAFQEALLVAVNSAPLRHGERVWQVVVKLLEKVGKELINKATEIAAELLVRLPTHSGFRFQEAIDAVTKRMEGTRVSKDEGYQTFGKLLGTYADKLVLMGEPLIDLEVLCTLKNHYFLFGGNVRSIVINLYLTPDVPTLAQRELLMEISTQPTSESFKEKEKAIALVQRVLPELILSAD
ncbi:MAG TPA: hypothetical protein DD379_20130, partial [Cyanobacteria bacterium UBA11162]|nr:hypothetical protein [Cyanobacteria bacterium UBA11162]